MKSLHGYLAIIKNVGQSARSAHFYINRPHPHEVSNNEVQRQFGLPTTRTKYQKLRYLSLTL